MTTNLRAAQPGDVCLLLEPNRNELPHVRRLQQRLQSNYGGRLQERVHFTCQRFEVAETQHLPQILEQLQAKLSAVSPFAVNAKCLELVEHPFWEFCVLRWDLRRCEQMKYFAGQIEAALAAAGLMPHYPTGDGWRPHVTALESIATGNGSNGYHAGNDHGNGANGNGAYGPQYLFTGQRVVLSQVQEGKRFEILATIDLGEERQDES